MLFSQRKGLKPVKSVMQVDSMDDDLRNGLWNCFYSYYNSHLKLAVHTLTIQDDNSLSEVIWKDFFKLPIDTMPQDVHERYDSIRECFFKCQWQEVYDVLEFTAGVCPDSNTRFVPMCNAILEREVSAYRFVGNEIVQITNEQEIAAIEDALRDSSPFKSVNTHLTTALKFMSDRKQPDYRNSIKESISAVEAICQLITKGRKAELGDALKTLKTKIELHPALEGAFQKMYGYTSDAEGIRHALTEEERNLSFVDAKFMLVSCAAFVSYLMSKAQEAGIKL